MEIFCSNRKARYEYHILETLEVGLKLQGCEIKSLREHKASLDGSYAIAENGEVWLIGSHIDEYGNRDTFGSYNPKRKRKLLLKKREISKFVEKAKIKGNTLIPLSIYESNGRAKIELAVCKGKQLHDKRQTEKERDADREISKF